MTLGPHIHVGMSEFEAHRDPLDPDNDSPVLQAALDWAADPVNEVRSLNIAGEWLLRTGLFATMHDKVLIAPASFTALEPIGTMFTYNGNYGETEGKLEFNGTGGLPIDSRTCDEAVKIETALSAKFDGWKISDFRYAGITTEGPGNAISVALGDADIFRVGSPAGLKDHVAVCYMDFIARVDSGSNNFHNQLTTLEFTSDGVVDPRITQPKINTAVFINGRLHFVHAIDTVAGTIGVYPKIQDTSVTTGRAYFAHGWGINSSGGNTSGFGATNIYMRHVGTPFATGSTGSAIQRFVVEAVGLGIQIGLTTSGTNKGGFIGHGHIEGEAGGIAQICRDETPFVYIAAIPLKLNKCWGLTNFGPQGATNKTWQRMNGVVCLGATTFNTNRLQLPDNTAPATLEAEPGEEDAEGTIVKDSPSITLKLNKDMNRLGGYDTVEFLFRGKTARDPGTITFETADSGHTIMGQSSPYTFSPRVPCKVSVVFLTDTNDWDVIPFHSEA